MMELTKGKERICSIPSPKSVILIDTCRGHTKKGQRTAYRIAKAFLQFTHNVPSNCPENVKLCEWAMNDGQK